MILIVMLIFGAGEGKWLITHHYIHVKKFLQLHIEVLCFCLIYSILSK